ncbi:MAG TPA: hypothetical protein VN256_03505 [Pyrinomonadaceae bacterium]|nr:hypothetical protein [Pyrinomonadaceae bacterium]
MKAAVAEKPEEKSRPPAEHAPEAKDGGASVPASPAGMPLFLRGAGLASTTDGVTTFDPAAHSHPLAEEIEAHEAVHRAQFNSSSPPGSRVELEQDAQEGAQTLLAGKSYAPNYSAAPGQTLGFDPVPFMPDADATARANAASLSTLGDTATRPSNVNASSAHARGLGGAESIHHHVQVSGSGRRGSVNTTTDISVTYDPGQPVGTGVGAPILRGGELGMRQAVPVALYPVVIHYRRELHLTDADGRDATVTINSNVNFTHESWARAIAGRELTFETLLSLRGDASEVYVNINGRGPVQPYYADYYFRGVSLNVQSAVAETSLMAGAGPLPFSSRVPARFVRAELTAGEQFDSLEAFLASADAEELARRARYPSQAEFDAMSPDQRRELASRLFWEEFDLDRVLGGILMGVGVLVVGLLAVAAAIAELPVLAVGLVVVAVIAAVWGLATLIQSMIRDVSESWRRGDTGAAILEVIKYVGLIVGIILGAIVLVVAVVTGGATILTGVAIAAVVAMVVAAVASIVLVFMNLDHAEHSERVEDFRHYVGRAAREAEESVINIVLLIISFCLGPLARRFGRGQREGGVTPPEEQTGPLRNRVPIDGEQTPVIEGEGSVPIGQRIGGTAEAVTLPNGRPGVRLTRPNGQSTTAEILSRTRVPTGEVQRVRLADGTEGEIFVEPGGEGGPRWRTLTPEEMQELGLGERGVRDGRPRLANPTDPPRNPDGTVDYAAWEQRLRAKGVRGQLSRKIQEAREGNHDSEAELRLAERYIDAGYGVEIMEPVENAGIRNPDLRITHPTRGASRVDVKFREPGARLTKNYLDNKISDASDQLSSSPEGRGDIVIDATEAAPDSMSPAQVEAALRGKLTGNRFAPTGGARLRNVEYLEVTYRFGGRLHRTYMFRDANGAAHGPFTEVVE